MVTESALHSRLESPGAWSQDSPSCYTKLRPIQEDRICPRSKYLSPMTLASLRLVFFLSGLTTPIPQRQLILIISWTVLRIRIILDSFILQNKHREISSVLCDHLEGWDREGGREGDARWKRYGNICICITDSLCYEAETNTPL